MPLRKFIETSPVGVLTGRIAYVVSEALLPPAGEGGASWREQRTFDEAAAEKKDAGLRQVFDKAWRDGVATIGKTE